MSERESTHLSEAQLDDLADGLLDPDARARATAHLAQCARCNRDLNATGELLRWSGQARSAVRAPAELWPLVAASTMHVAARRRCTWRPCDGRRCGASAASSSRVRWRSSRRRPW
jgi:anti-sigma factor RsiW